MIKPISLIQVYLYSLIVIILLISPLFGFFWIHEEVKQFQRESEDFKKEYLDTRKELIKKEVDNAVKYIEYERSRTEDRVKRYGINAYGEEKIIQEEVLESFEQFYFIESGYLFGGDWNGISLFGPSKGQNMFEIGDGKGSDTIRNFIDTARSGGGYVEYEIPDYNNDPDSMLKKISYIGGVDGWRWYIGSGLMLNEIEEVILQKQEDLNRWIKDLVIRIVSFILLFTVLAAISILLISGKIRNNLKIFKEFFSLAAHDLALIDTKKLFFRESIVLANSANHMVKERQKVLNELFESEKRFFQIVEAVNIPIAIGKSGNAEFLNKRFRETFGYTLKDMPTLEAMWELSYPDPAYRKKVQKEWMDALGETVDFTKPFKKQYCTVRCKNGEDLEVEIDFSPVGEMGLTTFRDLTEHKKREAENALLEQKLLRAQKMEAIGLMAGGVAHDLNNILSGIVGYPDLIIMSLDEDSEIRPHVEAIKRSGLRAADVVADLLTIARGVASTRKPCNLNRIINQYFESPEYEKLKIQMDDIKLIRNYDSNLLNITCSEVHLKKCVMNLVMNGIEAMENIGELTISTRNQYVDTPFSMGQYMEKGEYTVLSVKDSGHGIAEEDLERIFDPFYTKKVMGMSGTGLGLSVVWNTVQDHNGGIIVSSAENGTTFELFFPVDRNVTVDDFQSEEVVDIMGSGEMVLIIDDEPLQQEIATGMLDFLGYWTHSVSSGKEAILWLETNTVDILLLDMIMPSGLSGLQTYKEILRIHPGQKAIIASGYSQNKDVESTLKLGAGRFIKKPYTMDLLGKAMKHELRKK
ncbi:MAG: cache domain-containing protein [Spirochaetales bacterium]|nr:cache domain-containing protein [Spirochaetales bacterium]